ncbi:MAG TPA: hypothetical protein VFX12_13025 [Vicinamibacterales bacterium]|nr:hypothetical protein [Vicinamibacterales bacterium]
MVIAAVAFESHATSALLVTIAAGALLVAVPIWSSAVAARAPRPAVEALACAGTCMAAIAIYAYVFSPDTGPNLNTTESMMRRTRYFSTWHYPPELVWGFWLTVGSTVMCGLIAGVLARGLRGDRSLTLLRASMVFGIAFCGASLLAMLMLALVGPALMAAGGSVGGAVWEGIVPLCLGGFAAGALVGVVVTSARGRLQSMADLARS